MLESQRYRPDIDGLRAIAVMSVLAFHYGAPLPGGFTGVDVFFVISGFLITSKLNDDIKAGEFSILGFYDRRIRRILPALLVMLGATLLAGYVLLMPGEYESLAASVAMAAFGVSNFYFLTHTGYFDQTADLVPLLHTWSLAVEEQFYLVWPIALFAIVKARRGTSTILPASSSSVLRQAFGGLTMTPNPHSTCPRRAHGNWRSGRCWCSHHNCRDVWVTWPRLPGSL
jgi:peptidoglycan/LPS O-acetylase OafA/YrhL